MIPEILISATASAALAGVGAWGIFAPRSQFFGPLVWRGSTALPSRVALTFDDGPHPEATPRILDELAHLGARAAFFLIGQNAEKWPAIVRRIVDEGHLIGNHSYSHSTSGGYRFTGYWENEITRTSRLLEDIAGVRTAWFRPPFGVKQWHMHKAVRRSGHTMISYTLRGLDGVPTTPERIVSRIAPRAAGGDILTLHDGIASFAKRPIEPTIQALRPLVEGLRGRGLAIAPLDEMITNAPYIRRPAGELAANQ